MTRRTEEHVRILREIVELRDPSLLPLVDSLPGRGLDEGQREILRGILADELSETGLDPDDSPNERGYVIEDLIDWLGHV